MSLEELTIPQLKAICGKEGLSEVCHRKVDLVERLHKHYDETFTATPDKEFFTHLRKTWQEVKNTDDKPNKSEHFAETMRSWHHDVDSLIALTASQIKAHNELRQICKSTKPGDALMKYYRRGKEAWLEEKDNSSDEQDERQSGSESNYSDDKDDEDEEEEKDGDEDEDRAEKGDDQIDDKDDDN